MTLTSTDYVLTQDKSFKKWTKAYADDQELWFKEYALIAIIHAFLPFLTINL